MVDLSILSSGDTVKLRSGETKTIFSYHCDSGRYYPHNIRYCEDGCHINYEQNGRYCRGCESHRDIVEIIKKEKGMLQNLQAGNWVVLRNGKRRKVFRVDTHQINRKDVYLVDYGYGIPSLAYNIEGDRFFKGGIDHKDIVSVWNHHPKRREIMAMIKKGSFVNFRSGSRLQVTEVRKSGSVMQPIFIMTNFITGTFTDKGRYFINLKGGNDIMSVENGGL